MKKKEIISAVEQLCTMIETEIIGKAGTCVDCGAVLTGDNIDDYSIEHISYAECPEQIAVNVRFHAIASNSWHGRFYFIDPKKLVRKEE